MIKVTNTGSDYTIELFGDIGESWFGDGWTFERFKNELNGITASILNIDVKSNGGDVFEAFAIHDAIKDMPVRVKVNIVGSSASAATIIAAAGDEVSITENSRYLVHNAQTFVAGNKEELAGAYEQLKSIDDQILNIYVKRTGKPKNELAELMKQERWMTASEAVSWGFVDRIIKHKIVNQITNIMTPEEIAALQSENEALKAKVLELEGKLSEIEIENELVIEEENEALVTAAITAGKIKAEAKESLLALGKTNQAAMKSIIENITVSAPRLVDVPKPTPPPAKVNTKEQFITNLKAGVYKNNRSQAAIDYKAAYGREL